MLYELRVSQLGVIEDLSLVLGPGMTALTGETGAGKTLVVEAVELLVGGRADGALVRPGAAEALVEGRFSTPSQETVLSRAVPTDGRSRAYVDGRMSTVAALAEVGEHLVDLHGQHAHQSLLQASSQRRALDSFAGVEAGPRDAALAELRRLEEAITDAGGDDRARSRELDLLGYQLAELDAAGLSDPGEEDALAEEEEVLASAASHRAAAASAHEGLVGEEQVMDRVGRVIAALAGHAPLSRLEQRLRGLSAEVADIGSELRAAAETLEEDPERLAEVAARRAVLRDLRRKYGAPGQGLGAVLAYRDEAMARLGQLRGQQERAALLESQRGEALVALRHAAQELGEARRAAAGALGPAVEAELRKLAMPGARFDVKIGSSGAAGDLRELAGEEVSFLLSANPGEPLLPLARAASGGELARAMLALRLVLIERGKSEGDGPGTLVFDEVDAGVGGEAALAVGRALAELGRSYQVLVVTHLAQVAAYATAQVAVAKGEREGRTVATARLVSGDQRVTELSRMMSGHPGSKTARRHAEELLRSVPR